MTNTYEVVIEVNTHDGIVVSAYIKTISRVLKCGTPDQKEFDMAKDAIHKI